MLKRLNGISSFSDYDKEHILYAINGLIKSVNIAAL